MGVENRIARLSDKVNSTIPNEVQKAWSTYVDLKNDVAVVNLTKLLENPGGLLEKVAKAEGKEFPPPVPLEYWGLAKQIKYLEGYLGLFVQIS